jgi:imidazolonepropionase-like amidohydrolase
LRTFREAGLTLVAGSDAGIPTIDFACVIGELEVLVQAGYRPVDALRAATADAADAIRVGADRGRIKKGFRADLLLVEGAVHEDIAALRNRIAVLKDGRVVAGKERVPGWRS